MEDSQIVDLYWERNEQAIRAAASKYGDYCYSIAYNILRSRRMRMRASMIHTSARGTLCRRTVRTV